jgi:hypothetical protein
MMSSMIAQMRYVGYILGRDVGCLIWLLGGMLLGDIGRADHGHANSTHIHVRCGVC